MEWFPQLHLGWLNGWIFIVILTATEGGLFALFPRQVVKRLFDRSGWSPKQRRYTLVAKLIALVALFILCMTPLKLHTMPFYLGTGIAIVGWLGFIKALYDYRLTPMNELVTSGIYRYSRHPQVLAASLMIMGGAIAVGSWSVLLLMIITRILAHQQLLAEEEACLRQYGEAYSAYQTSTPRYFLFH